MTKLSKLLYSLKRKIRGLTQGLPLQLATCDLVHVGFGEGLLGHVSDVVDPYIKLVPFLNESVAATPSLVIGRRI